MPLLNVTYVRYFDPKIFQLNDFSAKTDRLKIETVMPNTLKPFNYNSTRDKII